MPDKPRLGLECGWSLKCVFGLCSHGDVNERPQDHPLYPHPPRGYQPIPDGRPMGTPPNEGSSGVPNKCCTCGYYKGCNSRKQMPHKSKKPPPPPAPPQTTKGWQCPGCGRCYSPIQMVCQHCGQK